MGLPLPIFGSALMFAAPPFVPEHTTVGFAVAVIGIILAAVGR